LWKDLLYNLQVIENVEVVKKMGFGDILFSQLTVWSKSSALICSGKMLQFIQAPLGKASGDFEPCVIPTTSPEKGIGME
jgi:hypothetical protein